MAINESKQRFEFGGFNWVSAFYGWLVAMAITALLTALFAAAGASVALTEGVSTITNNSAGVGIVSAILLLLGMAIAYYAGGYVAGRMSRFDGGRQGAGVWVMGIVAAVVLAMAGLLFGANYNLLQALNLPRIPVDEGALTAGGLTTLLLGLAVTFASAVAGARVGEAYHRRVDLVGAMDMDESTYEPVETVRPVEATEREEEPVMRREPGFSRREQPTFGERIERTERTDRKDRSDRMDRTDRRNRR
jgi:hypothetical protein